MVFIWKPCPLLCPDATTTAVASPAAGFEAPYVAGNLPNGERATQGVESWTAFKLTRTLRAMSCITNPRIRRGPGGFSIEVPINV